MVNFGNMSIADLRLGASQVKAAYFGSKQIWGGEEPGPVGDWLCFTAEQANSTVKLYKYNGGAPTLDIETSTDGQNWSAYTQGTVLSAANVGDKVYFRAGSTGNPTVSNTNKTNRFAITGKMAASGDLQYLLSQDGTTQPTGAWCFNCLFQYQTGLTEPPKCGAITLGTECYGGTFEGCTNLRHAPELNATNFVGQKVYINMFVGCTSLTTAPKLPATTLTTYCYNGMFDGCTSLSSVEVAFTTWTPNTSINWLRNVAASGTFTCPAELPDTRDANHIPTGWNIVHPQQELSAVCFTALENNSNIRLDKKQHAPNVSLEYSTDGGSTWSEYTWSSSTGPTITLATTGDKVYFRAKNDNQYLAQDINVGNYDRSSHWFASSAGKLKVSGNLNTLLSANNTPRDLDPVANKAAFSMLFNECANLYDATELSIPSMVIAEGCYQCLFRKCTNLSAGPLELPATTLASGCYNNLFENCNNILSVPAFPAAQTVNDCYAYMLYNCRKLNSISVGLTAWGGTNQWTNGVSSTGTFYCPSTLPENRGGSAIPNGWNVVHPVTATPLCFTAAGSNASVQLVHGNQAPSVSLETSTDGETWTSYSNEVISLPDAGDKVYFRAADVNGAFYASSIMNWQASYANYFDCSNVVVSGKLVSIFRKDMDESSMATPAYLAKNLFRNYNNRQTQIVDASGLEIPDKTYGVMAFQGTFSGSTLSAAPAFPGNAQIYCEQYAWLYENCTKLSSLPGNCLPGSPLTAFSTDGGRTGYGWYERIAGTLPLTSDLSVVVSDAASIPSYVFYNIFDTNSPFTGTFIIDMTSYTSVPTIQSNTFNNDTKPPRGSLEIRVPASLYDTWKNATNWTTWSSYLVPVGVPTQDLKLHFDAIDNAGVGNHLSSTSDWANIAPDTSADYKLHRTSGTWEDDSAVFTGAYDECFWLRNSSNAQIDNLFSSLNMLSSSWTYAIGLYYNPATIENYRGYIGQQQSYTNYAQIYLRTDQEISWLLVGYKQDGTSTGPQDSYFEGHAPNFKNLFTQNAFNTMVGTWDAATATFKVYVNGQLEFTWQSPGEAAMLGHELPLTLGGGVQSSGSNRVCKGKIHDFLVYSRALSDAEVAQLHDYQAARFNS